tara:strand:- start:438 stop:902 length:465 start_codon:yes stop_codon:yes gene_type:complete
MEQILEREDSVVRYYIFSVITLIFISLNNFAGEEHDHDMHDLMAHFLTPASEKIWESTGFVITEEGEFSLEPQDQEGWDEVIFGAQAIIESSYLLTLPDRAQGRQDWIAFSNLLQPIGKRALSAAEDKNAELLFQVGADLYQACVSCHNVYMRD